MSIYKSSFNNKKPEKKEKEKVEKIKPVKEKKSKVKKNRFPLIMLIVCSVIFLMCLFPNFFRNFILGLIGLSAYPLTLIGIFFSAMFLRGKRYIVKKRLVVYLSISLFIIWFIFHLILCSKIPLNSYGQFLADCYHAHTTAGGLIFSLLTYPFVKLVTIVGAYIIFAIALAIFVGLIIDYFNVENSVGHKESKKKFDFKNIEDFEVNDEVPKIDEEAQQKTIAKQRLGLTKGETTIISSSMPPLDLNSRASQSRPISKREYILTPLEPIIPTEKSEKESIFEDNLTNYSAPKRRQKTNFDEDVTTENAEEILPVEPTYETQNEADADSNTSSSATNAYDINQSYSYDEDLNADEDELFTDSVEDYNEISSMEDNVGDYEYDSASMEDADTKQNVDAEDNVNTEPIDENDLNLSNEDEEDELEDLYDSANNNSIDEENENLQDLEVTLDANKTEYLDDYSHKVTLGSTVETEVVRPSLDLSKFNLPNQNKHSLEKEKPVEPPKKLNIPPYVAPPVELLNFIENTSQITDDELQENIERLEQVLEDFKVPAKVNNVQVGPAVTRYELTMPRGISVNKIAQMSDDIAMTLASNGAIRVEAPIPGKNSVGIEVPNNQITSVSLRELIDSNEFKQRVNPLSFVLGKDINGDIIFCNLDKMPHVLVAGSTGSGKSVCLNAMLLSMCYKAGPQDLRLILIDPKMVEFTTYNGLPHLLIPDVITGKEMTINALDWAIKEMERRYALFAKNHVVNIVEFNKSEVVKSKKEDKLPYIVIIVDELADLMLEAKREIEDRIAKLAAKARAAGIHLVLATQRPSVDVITGTVKANLPSRIAFALTNYMDSKTVLDGGGAEKLLGKGDMLFKPQDKPEPRRVQGAYVSNAEIAQVVEFIKSHNDPVYDEDAGQAIKNPHQGGGSANASGSKGDIEFDPVLKDALRMFIQTKQASTSMISRRYSVGFNRAGRIIDQMERAGFIGPQDGSKPRQVLITMDEYNQIFGEDK